MTIQSDEETNQALEQIQRLYRTLAILKAEVLPLNPKKYAIMAEGPLDMIRDLRAQVDAYIGVEAMESLAAGKR